MNWTPQLQKQFGQEMDAELEKMTMSWNNDLKEWHPYALKALRFSSLVKLKVSGDKYDRLTEVTPHGINMNIVAMLCNNLETVTPDEMGLSVEGWQFVIKANQKISAYWEALAGPVRETVQKRLELLAGKTNKLIVAGQA